jgi:hypothetical protein
MARHGSEGNVNSHSVKCPEIAARNPERLVTGNVVSSPRAGTSWETSMNMRLLTTTAAIALIAGTTFASAQDRKEGGAAPSPAPAAQQNAPAEKTAPPAGQRGTDIKTPGGAGMKPGSSAQAPTAAGDKKVEGRSDMKASDNKADGKADARGSAATRENRASDSKSGDTKASDSKSIDTKSSDTKSSDTKSSTTQNSSPTNTDRSGANTTTGQGAAGARTVNLTTEQRTTIKTVIKEQKVEPVTNVNFSISVGTRIPRDVRHHPLPSRIVEIYPAWRGYEYILVRNEILVIDPRTLEIVAVIEA